MQYSVDALPLEALVYGEQKDLADAHAARAVLVLLARACEAAEAYELHDGARDDAEGALRQVGQPDVLHARIFRGATLLNAALKTRRHLPTIRSKCRWSAATVRHHTMVSRHGMA